jgi:methylase of polypeptide subunit release factors
MKTALSNAANTANTAQVAIADASNLVRSYSLDEVFFCPEESQFYSQCLEKLLLSRGAELNTGIEFGAGDGSPVISCLLKTQFDGVINGYELNAAASEVARNRIQQYGLNDRYKIHNRCFYEGLRLTPADFLIANPPYIPAPDNRIFMPKLYGGIDGAEISKKLLSVDCDKVLLMLSAYSNPIETIEHARDRGYSVADFTITPLQFGYYSSQPKVKNWIAKLRQQNKAFYSANTYFLAGVLFEKKEKSSVDLSFELLKVMTAL